MSFDLNIQNYTKSELEEMFNLSSPYDVSEIHLKENKLRENIVNNSQISQQTRVNTLNFLVQAKTILLNEKTPVNQSALVIPNPPSYKVPSEIYPYYPTMSTTPLLSQEEHMVQELPPLNNYSLHHTNPTSNHAIGGLNPLKRGVIIKNLNIDTRFRENYYTSPSTNFNFNLPMIFNNVLSMQLSAIEIPPSVFSISKQYNNNYFTININNEQTAVITIPDGTYSNLGIANVINNALQNLGNNFQYIRFTANTSSDLPDFDPKNGTNQMIVDINGTNTPIQSFSLNFQADRLGLDDRNTPLPLKLGWMLGFRNGIYENSVSYVSEGIIDVNGNKYFFLVVDDFHNNVNNGFYSAFNSSVLNSNILARISFNMDAGKTGNGPYLTYPNSSLNIVTSTRQYFGPVNIQNFMIQLLDQYGRIVDLNNMDFSFCLSLTTSYDS